MDAPPCHPPPEPVTLLVRDAGTRLSRSYWVRLRKYVKLALRSYGLKVIRVGPPPAGR